MIIDSHCHLDYEPLINNLDQVLINAKKNNIIKLLSIGTSLESSNKVLDIVERYNNVYGAIGIHPNSTTGNLDQLNNILELKKKCKKIIAFGETGLDYFRMKGDLEWQRERFRVHIRASRESRKPLIIHTRAAAEDTLKVMREEGADKAGGVMHCFTESLEVARAAMDLGFYISFSGIVTFKNAKELKAVAAAVPLERMLVETDSPYLAPVPFRGRTNQPGYVKHVAEEIARLKGVGYDEVCRVTTDNFFKLFKSING